MESIRFLIIIFCSVFYLKNQSKKEQKRHDKTIADMQ